MVPHYVSGNEDMNHSLDMLLLKFNQIYGINASECVCVYDVSE